MPLLEFPSSEDLATFLGGPCYSWIALCVRIFLPSSELKDLPSWSSATGSSFAFQNTNSFLKTALHIGVREQERREIHGHCNLT